MTISKTKAYALRPESQAWPKKVSTHPERVELDVYSDGLTVYVLFPWNADTNAEGNTGWRADNLNHKLWDWIKEAHPNDWGKLRYRAAWHVGQSIMLEPITEFPRGNVRPDKVTEQPADTITQGDVLYIRADIIRRVAGEYADSNGWCDEVNNALEDMGISGGTLRKRTVNVDLRVTLVVEGGDEETEDLVKALLPERLTLVSPDADGDASVVLDFRDLDEE